MDVVTTSITWEGSKSDGEALLASISPDDPEDFDIKLHHEENFSYIRINVKSRGLSQSRTTVDDLLACLSAAESGLDSLN